MMIFLQKYFLKGFLKNGCIWTKFREALCDMDKKIKKSMKMTIFYDAITCTYADPLLANKLPLRSIFLKFINLLKNFIWRGESWNPATSRMDKEPSVSRTQSNILEPLTIFAKSPMSDARMDSEYASGLATAAYELKHTE